MKAPSRSAFTLVELLVVIAIIGILVALLMPAVQAAREAARRMQCSNNLKQIGIGFTNYESQIGVYPPGAFWTGSNTAGYRGSILVHLLPFIEQQNVYDQFDFTKQVDGQTMANGQEIGSTIISTYVCPSDDNRGTLNNRAIHNYSANNGPTAHINNSSCNCANNWNSYSLSPYEKPDNFAGPFYRGGVSVTQSDIRDGNSNTIFFGEVRRACSNHTMAGWARSNNGNGLVSTQVPINVDTCDPNASADPCRRPCNWATELAFKSQHPGGCLFVFGDGSVHFLSESIDHWNYQYLGAKADGQVATLP